MYLSMYVPVYGCMHYLSNLPPYSPLFFLAQNKETVLCKTVIITFIITSL